MKAKVITGAKYKGCPYCESINIRVATPFLGFCFECLRLFYISYIGNNEKNKEKKCKK